MANNINSLILTDAAKIKALELIQKENDATVKLRIFVVGGGCSGMRYGFAFDKKVNKDDTIFDNILLIDWVSLTYLKSATIDYKNEQFSVHNPNIRTGCSGCGHH